MKGAGRIVLALALVLCIGLAHAIDPLEFDSDAQRQRFDSLTKELRCMVCQNEDLAESNADLARDLRRKILDMMQAGQSDAEIKDYLVDRYSQFVLYRPRMQRSTWALWFGPAVIVLLGAGAAFTWVRRRARSDAKPLVETGDEDWEENW